jgi:phage terminase large subunit-like protein
VSGALDLLSGMTLDTGATWGSVAADFQRADAAAIFAETGPRWHYLVRPRGGSKTTDAAGIALAWLATEAPAGARAYVIASDEDQAALLIDSASGLIDGTPALRSAVSVQSLKLTARSGATVEALPADGSGAFGLRPHLVIVDEFANWPATRNSRRVWTAILSAMHKVPGSRLVILTSAGEPNGQAYKVLVEARRSDRWRTSEVSSLPWVSEADLEAQRPLLRESEFARLHRGEWVQSEDRLVSEEDLLAAAVLDGPQAPLPGVKYVVTLDVGLVRDATVVVVAHSERVSGEPDAPVRVIVDRLWRVKGSRLKPIQLSAVEEFILRASREYHSAPLHADPYQAQNLIQRLRAKGVRSREFVFSSQSVGRVANTLHLALRNRLLWIPNDPDLLAELGRVRLRESSPGAVRLDHDSGEHDDQAVAVAIACSVLESETPSAGSMHWAQGRIPGVGRAPTGGQVANPAEVTPKGNAMPVFAHRFPPGTPEWQRRIVRKQLKR